MVEALVRHGKVEKKIFYIRKGDEEYTDLLGGRVPKYALRPEACGTLDEATSFLGFARALPTSPRTKQILIDIQRDIYQMMAELAFTPDIRQRRYHITAEDVARIEQETDRLSEEVPLPPQFILPSDTVAGGVLDVARAVIRRAERVVVRLAHEGEFDNSEVLSYLNRLSSLLFIVARYEDHIAGVTPTLAKEV